jgi:hypothetical protein
LPVTVMVAVPVTTVLLEVAAIAVMVELPWPTPVARPPVEMVATWTLLELQVTWLVRSSVVPEERVPIAMNWLVWPGEASDCEPGMMASETSVPVPLVPPVPVTVMVAEAVIDPDMLAVIVELPADTAVANPVELTVATDGVLDDQVT